MMRWPSRIGCSGSSGTQPRVEMKCTGVSCARLYAAQNAPSSASNAPQNAPRQTIFARGARADEIDQLAVAGEILLRRRGAVVCAVVDQNDVRRLARVGHAVEHIGVEQPGARHAAAAAAREAHRAVGLVHRAQVQPLRGQRGVGGAVVILVGPVELVDQAGGLHVVVHVDEHALGDRIADELDQRTRVGRQRARRLDLGADERDRAHLRAIPARQHLHAALVHDPHDVLARLRRLHAQVAVHRRLHARAAIHAHPQVRRGVRQKARVEVQQRHLAAKGQLEARAGRSRHRAARGRLVEHVRIVSVLQEARPAPRQAHGCVVPTDEHAFPSFFGVGADQKLGGVHTQSTEASVLPALTRLCGASGLKEKLSPLRTL